MCCICNIFCILWDIPCTYDNTLFAICQIIFIFENY
nr:MAG TPA: hypothetical protein [Caudoviricetes sp.]